MINHRKRLDYQQIHTICLYSRRVFLYTFYTEIDIFQSHQDRGNKNADTTTQRPHVESNAFARLASYTKLSMSKNISYGQGVSLWCHGGVG